MSTESAAARCPDCGGTAFEARRLAGSIAQRARLLAADTAMQRLCAALASDRELAFDALACAHCGRLQRLPVETATTALDAALLDAPMTQSAK